MKESKRYIIYHSDLSWYISVL